MDVVSAHCRLVLPLTTSFMDRSRPLLSLQLIFTAAEHRLELTVAQLQKLPLNLKIIVDTTHYLEACRRACCVMPLNASAAVSRRKGTRSILAKASERPEDGIGSVITTSTCSNATA